MATYPIVIEDEAHGVVSIHGLARARQRATQVDLFSRMRHARACGVVFVRQPFVLTHRVRATLAQSHTDHRLNAFLPLLIAVYPCLVYYLNGAARATDTFHLRTVRKVVFVRRFSSRGFDFFLRSLSLLNSFLFLTFQRARFRMKNSL